MQKRLKRSQVEAFFAKLPPSRIGIETRGSALSRARRRDWGRTLLSLGV